MLAFHFEFRLRIPISLLVQDGGSVVMNPIKHKTTVSDNRKTKPFINCHIIPQPIITVIALPLYNIPLLLFCNALNEECNYLKHPGILFFFLKDYKTARNLRKTI